MGEDGRWGWEFAPIFTLPFHSPPVKGGEEKLARTQLTITWQELGASWPKMEGW